MQGMSGWDDVASHIGQTVTKKFDKSHDKPLTVSLLHNPSHLEVSYWMFSWQGMGWRLAV